MEFRKAYTRQSRTAMQCRSGEAMRAYDLERWRAALGIALERQRQFQSQLRLVEERRHCSIVEKRESLAGACGRRNWRWHHTSMGRASG